MQQQKLVVKKLINIKRGTIERKEEDEVYNRNEEKKRSMVNYRRREERQGRDIKTMQQSESNCL